MIDVESQALLLDRDGLIVVDKHYAFKPQDVELEKNAPEGLRLAVQQGLDIAVVTNQSGIARGIYTEEQYEEFTFELIDQLKAEGVSLELSQFYFCPHHTSKAIVEEYRQDCECRKPKPGLFHQARESQSIDLSKSYGGGDRYSDVEAASRADCKGNFLSLTGKQEDDKGEEVVAPTFIARDLLDAVEQILEREQ